MKIKIYLCLCAVLCLAYTNANAQKDKNKLMDDEYEVQFLKTAVEGTILFKIYSYGKNEDDCIANAKRNAIKAIIFNGIPGSDLQKPLVTDIEALTTHKDYFTIFFQNKGKYLQYVSLSTDGSIDSNDRLKVGKYIKVGIAVLVQKTALRNELEKAGIIKSLGHGF
jgi:hypothetical protein